MCLQHEYTHTHAHKGYMFIKQVYARRLCTSIKKYKFDCTLIQPKYKRQMSNEKPYVLLAVKPKIDVQYIQEMITLLLPSFAAATAIVAALFLYYTVFCFVVKINRCVREHIQCNLIPLSTSGEDAENL